MTRKTRHGFSLIELTIVISIVGILAAIALPSYQRYIYRAKAAEVILVMDKIRTAVVTEVVGRGLSLGGDTLLLTRMGQTAPVALQVRSSPGVWHDVALRPADLELKDLGIRMEVFSGFQGSATPGELCFNLFWSTGQDPLAVSSRQIVLATHDVLRSVASHEATGSGFATVCLDATGQTQMASIGSLPAQTASSAGQASPSAGQSTGAGPAQPTTPPAQTGTTPTQTSTPATSAITPPAQTAMSPATSGSTAGAQTGSPIRPAGPSGASAVQGPSSAATGTSAAVNTGCSPSGSPGASGSAPGHGAAVPGHGGVPPGQACKP